MIWTYLNMITASPLPRTAFDNAVVDHLYHKIHSDQSLDTQQNQRPRPKSLPDSFADPMHMMGWGIAKDSQEA